MQQGFVKVRFLKAFAEGTSGFAEGDRDTLAADRARELSRAGIVELLENAHEVDPAETPQRTAALRQPETTARRRTR